MSNRQSIESHTKLKIMKFACEEIIRQEDTVETVYPYTVAWLVALDEFNTHKATDGAHEVWRIITPEDVVRWWRVAMPDLTEISNYRRINLLNRKTDSQIGVDHQHITRQMNNLFTRETLTNLSPLETYKHFLDIHPFYDGNGRTAKIIYNWMLMSLADPQLPPKVYNDC